MVRFQLATYVSGENERQRSNINGTGPLFFLRLTGITPLV